MLAWLSSYSLATISVHVYMIVYVFQKLFLRIFINAGILGQSCFQNTGQNYLTSMWTSFDSRKRRVQANANVRKDSSLARIAFEAEGSGGSRWVLRCDTRFSAQP